MKNRSKIVSIVFISFIILAQIAFISVPTARAYSLQDFSISPNPSSMPLLLGHSYEFTLTATLPGGSGSNGVNVYLLPLAGQISGTDLIINYVDLGNGANPIHIPRNGNSGSAKMILTIPLDATPGPLPLTVTAYDNPGGGGTMIGTFTVTLHVNQIPLVVQTSGLYSSTNVYIGGTKVGTAYDGVPYGPVWFQLDPSTGNVTIGAIGVDNIVSGSVQYFFSSWTDSTSNPHPAITTNDPITLTANYVTKTSQITITSNPTGSSLISVDGTTYSSPHTFNWAVGSTHNLQALSPVAGSSGTQYVYDNWSDNGAQSHNYIVSSTSPATIIANYKTQYSVTFAVTPNGAGTTNPSSGTNIWVNAGALAISATSNPGSHFDHWSSNTGSITFASATDVSTTSTINSPGTITANFAYNPVTHFSVAAPGSVVAGSSFQVTVTALDADGNTITGYTGLVHITSSDALAALPADATLTNGIGVFAVTLKTAGSQNIMASDNSIFGSTSVTVLADSSSTKLEVSAPSSATAGVPFSFTVTAKDNYGNTVTGYAGTIHFTSTSSGSLPSDSSLTSGTATFSATLTSSGTKTITATDKVQPLITGTSSIIVVAPAAQLYSLSITGYPSSLNAGETFSTDVTITAYDNFGNIKTDYTGSIYFTSTDAKATLPYNESLKYSFTTSDTGSHTFSGSTFSLYTTGMQTITVTDGSISKESNSIKVNHAASGASYFVVDTPGAANAGSTISVIVTAKDQFGNTVTDYSGTVIFTSTDSKADLPATSTLDNGIGNFVATFKTAGSQTITATDSTNNEINGTSSVVVVGTALSGTSALVVTSQANAQAGLPFSVTVKAVDLYGNLVPEYAGIVHLNSSDLQSTISSDSTLTGGIGVFTVTLRTAGTQVITATDIENGTITGTTTVIVSVDSTSAAHFDITSPSFVDANQSFSLTITTKDQFGNIVTGYSGTVHFSSSDTGSNVNLPTDYTFLVADEGSHKFSDLKLVTAGTQTITTTDISTGISGTVSIHVNVPANSADHLVISTQASASAGESFIVTVTVKDAFGNTVTGYTGTVHFTSTDSSAILPVDYTFQAVDSGNKAFDGVILETAGLQTITSTDTVTSSITGTSDNITVTANAASPGSIKVTPTSAQIYAGDNQAFTAELFDIFGNSLGDVTNKVTWSINVEAKGSWEQATGTYTSEIASPDGSSWTVAASTNGLSGYSTLTVIHSIETAKLSNVTITPSQSTIMAGENQSYTAIATDIYGNSWDVSTDKNTNWKIDSAAAGSWNLATYTSAKQGTWTVTGTYMTVSDSASLTVTHATDQARLDHITASVNPTSVSAPNTATGTAIAYDIFGNTWDISTLATWSIPAGNDGGIWAANIYTSNKAGAFTIQANYEGKTANAKLTVTHSTDNAYLDHIAIAPKQSTVSAGVSQTYTATAYDSFNNSWSISATYACSNAAVNITGNLAYSNTTGNYIIMGSYNGKTDSATLTVTGHLSTVVSIAVAPKTASIPSGTSQIFIATASDGYNSWDATNQVVWSIVESGDSGSWNQATGTYTSAKAGVWTVKAALNQNSDTAQLTVNANPALLDHITISPKSATIISGNSQAFSVAAYDQFGNSLGDVTSSATITAPGAIVSSNSVSAAFAGTYMVNATYNGKSDAATLVVISAPSSTTTTTSTTTKQNPITYTVTFTEYGLPNSTTWSLTFNGQTKSTNATTITFTAQNGNYQWMVQTPITNSVTRYTADNANETLSVTASVTQNITFTTQYYLDIQSLHGNVTGSGWYNANKTAQFSVTEDSRSQYAFSSWTGTGAGSYNGNNQNATVAMISPIVEIAKWDQATSLWLVLLVILIVMGLLMAILIRRKRRNKKKENNIEPNAPKKPN